MNNVEKYSRALSLYIQGIQLQMDYEIIADNYEVICDNYEDICSSSSSEGTRSSLTIIEEGDESPTDLLLQIRNSNARLYEFMREMRKGGI